MSEPTLDYQSRAEYQEFVAQGQAVDRVAMDQLDWSVTVIKAQESSPKPLVDRRIIAVIPAFNEERFIASVVLRTFDYASHVIVVDDGSSDATAILAERIHARVIRQPNNRGKAQALRAGFREALKLAADVIVCLDADAQHDPADIPRVATPILEDQADVVIGTRFHKDRSNIPSWRRVGQHTLTAVTNALSGVCVSDSQSGFRAFSVDAATTLKFHSGGLSVESEMQFMFAPAGLRVVEVPIRVHYLDGNKRNPVVHGLEVLDAMLSLVARRRPLMFFTVPGAAVTGLGGFIGITVASRADQQGELLVGVALLAVLLSLTGVVLSVTGVMLHSIGHLFGRLKSEYFDELSQS